MPFELLLNKVNNEINSTILKIIKILISYISYSLSGLNY